ncbi:MAG: histidine kinase [Actinomycetota bacterium]|nr:histidine kinase [Actinomycetota bacterium]
MTAEASGGQRQLEGAPAGGPAENSNPNSDPDERRGRVAVATVAGLLLALTAVFVQIRLSLPADGTITSATSPRPDGVEITALIEGGSLRSGDVVTAVNGRSLASRSLPTARVGDQLVYRVAHDGQIVDAPVTVRRSYPLPAALGRHWPSLILAGSVVLVALYVFARRPDDRAARALLVVAALLTCGSTAWVFGLQVLDIGGGPGFWANLGAGVAYILVWPAMLHFALVFPEPRALVRRHPGVLALVYLSPLALYAVRMPFDLASATTDLQRVGALIPRGTLVELVYPWLILGAFYWAYRDGPDCATRTRLRWVAGSFGVATVLFLVFWQLPLLLTGRSLVSQPVHVLLFLPCPIAIGIAILRLQLFDIDVAIRRSIVYAALTTCVVIVYVATVTVLSRVLHHRNEWTSLAATGLVAVMFSPLRDRLQRGVSRLLYGERDDPYAIVSRLGQRLERVPAPGEVLPQLVKTVAEALRLPYAAIVLERPDGGEETVAYGTLVGSSLRLPLTYHEETVGQLVVGERTPGDGFGRRDHRALETLAHQVGVAVRAARLTLDLQRSRERLVTAREEERRRLRHDLHDGLGPSLAATALQLQTARRSVRSDPEGAEAILERLANQTQMAIADVRRIVNDLRPASLDQLGLLTALKTQAAAFEDGALRLTVDAEGDLTTLPAAVEVAAFRIACEAMNNAYRHGGAQQCAVRLVRDGALELEVTDDGRGLPAQAGTGVGLASMAERAAELGGSFVVEPAECGGTKVRARLPLEPQ